MPHPESDDYGRDETKESVAEMPEGEIPQAMAELNRQKDMLRDVSEGLRIQLEPILRTEPEKETAMASDERDYTSPLAQSIGEASASIRVSLRLLKRIKRQAQL